MAAYRHVKKTEIQDRVNNNFKIRFIRRPSGPGTGGGRGKNMRMMVVPASISVDNVLRKVNQSV